MTIIAYHDGILMADRKSVIFDDACHAEIVTEHTKIFTSVCGRYACGVVGRVKTQAEMNIIIPELAKIALNRGGAIDISKQAEEVVNLAQTGYVFISAPQIAIFTHEEVRFVPNGYPVFAGSGGYLAKGYMLSGKTLQQSVEFASRISCTSGKVFDRIDCRKLFKKDTAMAKQRKKV